VTVSGTSCLSPGFAQAIISCREHNGAFKPVEDLKNVPRLDFSKIEAKKDLLVFD
jgi:DNA uptake protein ComE-like DNA-binding protein